MTQTLLMLEKLGAYEKPAGTAEQLHLLIETARRAHAELVRSGETVNRKKVYRIWREEGLCLPRKRPKKKTEKREDPIPEQAECPNHVWTYDFMFDALENGRRIKILTVEDEFTREALAIHVDKSIKAKDVICVLADLFATRGSPWTRSRPISAGRRC